MKHLPKPLPDTPAEEIWKRCALSCRDTEKRELLLSCLDSVRRDGALYEQLIPHRIQHWAPAPLPDGISGSELYKTKFAAKNAPGRPYYNAIMAQANGICPICGVRTTSTLDHYLPQSRAFSTALLPVNLIPSCRDCNTDKHDSMTADPRETPVHIYLDEIPDGIWLHADIGEHFAVSYRAGCPESWEDGIRSRVESHLKHYNLNILYSSHAAQEIASMQLHWRTLLHSGGEEKLIEAVHSIRISSEQPDMNSWKAALYRALEAQFTEWTAWL